MKNTGTPYRLETAKAVYWHPSYLTNMHITSCKMPDWMKRKLISRLQGEILVTSDMQMIPPLWQKVKNWRASWWRWKRWVKKLAYFQHSKNKDHHIWSHHFMTNRWGNNGYSNRVLGCKITTDGNCSHEIKRHLFLGRKAMTNLDSILKSRGITLLKKVHLVKAMVFLVVMYRCESWTIKKAECWRNDAFELWCLEDSWESLGLQQNQNSQSWRKPVLNIHWKDWCWSWSSNTLNTWCEELTH